MEVGTIQQDFCKSMVEAYKNPRSSLGDTTSGSLVWTGLDLMAAMLRCLRKVGIPTVSWRIGTRIL